ncbi:tetratricopeptide (TPR) repeat protein [Pseudochelatococcus contaminans]|uniref:Tetratricopeptide (TPR) repeat protein n=1 Tax=Pseudochelatococcus contaminans TaxID=1538103 RepID=A0A7W6EIQ1_9HYPH|nr:tetratricopeptide (TPR) repeat protein [Pseudochelatococcus contaminans]
MNTRYRDLRTSAQKAAKSGYVDKAGEYYLEAARLLDNDREALLYRASAFSQAGRKEEAVAAYRLLLDHHPDYADGWTWYGMVLKRAGNNTDAIEALQKSLSIRSDIDTRNALVTLLARADRKNDALAQGFINLIEKDRRSTEYFNSQNEKPALKATEPLRAYNPRAHAKNIIAFSLWGDNPVYVHGAIQNARITPHLYTGWKARFYHDDSVPADALEELRRAGAQTIRVVDPDLARVKPFWRFLASDDPQIDFFLCRDADSRLNGQELIAVEEWLRSGKAFHIMRDHVYHMELILAGMWGGAAGLLPSIREILRKSPKYFDNKFADQLFLANEVWPLIKDHTLTHDTYYHFNDGRDFPAAYRLPYPVHVGGAVKSMPHWRATGDQHPPG